MLKGLFLVLFFLSSCSGLYYEQVYAGSTCSGPVLFAENTHVKDATCSPIACRVITDGRSSSVTCPTTFVSLGVDQESYQGPTLCRGLLVTTRTYPPSPACGGDSTYTCSSGGDQINQLRYSVVPPCGGALFANTTFSTRVCIDHFHRWKCPAPNTTATTSTTGSGTRAPGMATSFAPVFLLVLAVVFF